MFSIHRDSIDAARMYQCGSASPHDTALTFHAHEMRDSNEMATAVVLDQRESRPELWDKQSSSDLKSLKTFGMQHSKSLFLLPSINNNDAFSDCNSSLGSSTSSEDSDSGTHLPKGHDGFAATLRSFMGSTPNVPDFRSSALRKVMEPHLRQARLQREHSRRTSHHKCAASIASSVGVPYTSLRRESPFLFDEHSYPLHTILAKTLNVSNLCQIHVINETESLKPLLNIQKRHDFHQAYDTFVTSFCIPLLHSMAISKQLLQHSASDRIIYRYQSFPTIQVSRPGDTAIKSPTCDTIQGHSVGYLTFHIPLTPAEGTNALFIESHPGKEDWHPLQTKSVGLGYIFDGSRCLHFDLENATCYSRVSLVFRILIHRGQVQDTNLCPIPLLWDNFSNPVGTYYEEAIMDPRHAHAVVKTRKGGLLEPDHRLGSPFTECS